MQNMKKRLFVSNIDEFKVRCFKIKFSNILLLLVITVFMCNCKRVEWIEGYWIPNDRMNISDKVGYNISDGTITGYIRAGLFSNIQESYKNYYSKCATLKYKVNTSNETECVLEFISGDELMQTLSNNCFVSKVKPGTLITIKKTGDSITVNRNFEPPKNELPGSQEYLEKQYFAISFCGSNAGGVYSLNLHRTSFLINPNVDISKKK